MELSKEQISYFGISNNEIASLCQLQALLHRGEVHWGVAEWNVFLEEIYNGKAIPNKAELIITSLPKMQLLFINGIINPIELGHALRQVAQYEEFRKHLREIDSL